MNINATARRYRLYFKSGKVREKILSNKSIDKNKTSLLGKVRNGINSLYQSYDKRKKQSSKKINSLLQRLNKKISKKKNLIIFYRNIRSMYIF